MANQNRISKRRSKAQQVKAKVAEYSTDATEAFTGSAVNIAAARKEYIDKNAIQIKAPQPENKGVAMDSANPSAYQASFEYVNQHLLSYYIASSSFIGYYAMSLISQHWLVMKGCSQKVKDAMKKGYVLTKNDGSELDKKELRNIGKLDKKHKLDRNIIEAVTFNNVFGIRHVLFKHTDPDFDYSEPYNADAFKGGKYAGIAQIDPYWITPVLDDSDITDPTSIGYYEPTFWLINGKRYHKSHFVILKGEEVSDYLKPTYRYGGVSMAQKVYERVYAAERTANEIPQLAMTKRLNVRKVDLAKAQADKAQFTKNLQTMNDYRDNYGVQVIGKEEDLMQIETTLTDLDTCMWAEYHITAAQFDIPVSKLFGTGFGGFSTGETDEDYYVSSLEALQSDAIEDIMYAHYDRLMPSEFKADMDMDIVFNPLKVMSAKERAEVNKMNADTAGVLYNTGAISDYDIREAQIADKDSLFSGMESIELEESEPEETEEVEEKEVTQGEENAKDKA